MPRQDLSSVVQICIYTYLLSILGIQTSTSELIWPKQYIVFPPKRNLLPSLSSHLSEFAYLFKLKS